jgi:iron(III) transport system substrate-binding protein
VIDDSKWMGGFDAAFLDLAKQYAIGFALRIQYNTQVNRDVVPESQLRTAEDLLKPEFRGRIAILDPRVRSAGANQISAFRKAQGDDFIRRLLVDQEPVLTNDRRQNTEWVVRGRYPIGLGVSDDMLLPFLEQSVGKQVQPLQTEAAPVGAGNGALALVNRAPHPNAAKVFINWLLSQETQAAWSVKTEYPSRRLDVPEVAPDFRPDPAHLDRYFNPSIEANAAFHLASIELAQRLRP